MPFTPLASLSRSCLEANLWSRLWPAPARSAPPARPLLHPRLPRTTANRLWISLRRSVFLQILAYAVCCSAARETLLILPSTCIGGPSIQRLIFQLLMVNARLWSRPTNGWTLPLSTSSRFGPERYRDFCASLIRPRSRKLTRREGPLRVASNTLCIGATPVPPALFCVPCAHARIAT